MTAQERARTAARVAAIAIAPVGVGAAGWLSGRAFAMLAGCGVLGAVIGVAIFGMQGRGGVESRRAPVTSATIAATSTPAAAQSTATSSESSAAVPPASAASAPSSTSSAKVASITTSASAPPSASQGGDSLEREVAMLQEANRKLAADPAGALTVLDAHKAKFPNGMLSAEREVLAVDALKRLGRTAEAKRRGDAFLAGSPSSLYADRVRKLIDGL